MDAMFKIMENASKIEWPYLLLHGDADLLCEVGGSKEFHEKTSSKDKTFKVFMMLLSDHINRSIC